MSKTPLSKTSQDEQDNAMPPFFKSWRSIYVLVVVNLATLITLFYLLTRHYS